MRPRKRLELFAVPIAVLAITTGSVAKEMPGSAPDQARQLLENAALAYQNVSALRDRLRWSVTSGGERASFELVYTLGEGQDLSIRGPRYEIVSIDERMYIVRRDVADKYIETRTGTNLRTTIQQVLGENSPPVIPPVTLRGSPTLESLLEDFRLDLLDPLEIGAVEPIESGDGRSVLEVQLLAENGKVRLWIRPDNHFLSRLQARVQNRDPETEESEPIEIDVVFSPEILTDVVGLVTFDPADRRQVDQVDKLVPTRMAAGEVAPPLALPLLAGGQVALTGLSGRAVILDFWSSNCEPCRRNLAESQELHRWVTKSSLSAIVLSVNTLEEVSNASEAVELVRDVQQAENLSLRTLLDWNHELFITLGAPSVPTLFIIGPDGRIVSFYDGASRPSLEALQEEIEALLKAGD